MGVGADWKGTLYALRVLWNILRLSVMSEGDIRAYLCDGINEVQN